MGGTVISAPYGVQDFAAETGAMLELLRALVEAESPSEDVALTAACAELVADRGARALGMAPELVATGSRTQVRWRFGRPRVLVLCHLDTVWPRGTIRRWPFQVADGRATGPGVFDMKIGLVQALFAVAALPDRDGVELLVTTDEEIGSVDSRELLLADAADVDAVLVLEASLDGALKTERKGAGRYRLAVTGRSAHAGLEPGRGVNATVELARQVGTVAALADAGLGTTVTPTTARSGDVANQVPAWASLDVDVRASSMGELERVDRAIQALRATLPGALVRVEGGVDSGPLPREASAELFTLATRTADALGIGPLRERPAGGTSDGNHTAGIGVPTLDGLGGVGGNAHAEGEWIDITAVPERTALVFHLLRILRSGGPIRPRYRPDSVRTRP